MKVKNTYTRKKKGKPVGNASSNVVINLYCNFLTVNIANNGSTHGNSESNRSESSDVFDKLVKGPIYNVKNQSKDTFGSSECSKKFFSQRQQDSATFYKSDAEFSISTDISNHLFKDSDIYTTPTWPSPPEYCKIKNKLVKIKKEQTLSISQQQLKQISQKKTYNRIQKKRIKVTKLNKVVAKVKPVPCTSSTPNRSDAVLNRYAWPDKQVSPIMPLQYSPSPEHTNASGQDEQVKNHNAVLSVTALIEGLGNLGIETPHRKKFVDVVNYENQDQELFDYKSPLAVSPNHQSDEKDFVYKVDSENQEPDQFDSSPLSDYINRQSDEFNGDGTHQSGTDMTSKKLEEDNLDESEPGQLPCKSLSPGLIAAEGLGNLGIETPHRKNFVDVVNYENQDQELFDYKSPLAVSPNHQSDEKDFVYKVDSGIETPHRKKFVDVVNYENQDQELFDYKSPLAVSPNHQSDEKDFVYKVDSENQEPDQFDSSPLSDYINRQSDEFNGDGTHQSGTDMTSKKLEEDNLDESEPGQLPCKSLSPGSIAVNNHDVLGYSAIGSPCTKALRDPENSLNNYKNWLIDDKTLSSIPTVENSEKYSDNSDHNCSSQDLQDKSNKYYSEEINGCKNIINIEEEDTKSEVYEEDSQIRCLNDYQESPIKELKIKIESSETKSQTYTKDQEVGSLIESNRKTSDQEFKMCVSQPLGDSTNLTLDAHDFEKLREIYKQSMPLGKENKRAAQYSMKPLPTVNKPSQQSLPTVNKLSLQPLPTDLNETLGKVNLEAGKKWRRSLLHQKQPETKFDRRVSMSAVTLVRMIRESRILSGLTNDTKVSCNNTTRIIDSLLETQEADKSSLPVPGGSPGFNFTFRTLSRIHTRKRRLYIYDENEIPEEISDHSTGKCNETEFCEEESVLQQDRGNVEKCESVGDTTVNRADAYETPPILKMNPEALSAITDRKRSRRYRASSLDNLEDYNEQNIELMGKISFLLRCGQQEPIIFSEAFPRRVLNRCKKIGEGVFGEVFMLDRPGEGRSVIKILPVEGSQLVNGERQKRFDEVLSELVITEELSMLRQNDLNCTTGFCELKNKFYLQGQYPPRMVKLWHEFDDERGSFNQCPDMFGPDQLYLALELAHAGEAIETFSFRTPQQALAVFLQTTFSLAVAESAAEFEHRDLHVGNVLVQKTTEKYIPFVLNGTRFECPTNGTMATIIDYTLSRIAFQDDVLYFDLEKDPELFMAGGDYQFDIYRHMRADLQSNWRDHQPKTNIRWLHYLIDKLSNRNKYKQKKFTKVFKEYMDMLAGLKEIILDFYSATDLAFHLIESYCQTVSLIRK